MLVKIRRSAFVYGLLIVPILMGCSKKVPQNVYVITTHQTISVDGVPRDEYTITHNDVVLTARYFESQTNSSPSGSNTMEQLSKDPKIQHAHRFGDDANLSQIPEVGQPIRQCVTHKNELHGDEITVAVQPTPDPCMVRFGNLLQYEPTPNAARFTYVTFGVVSEHVR
jgi:hypothetical protein